jgi:glycosyltransferase involved in cell wall biosynthesis
LRILLVNTLYPPVVVGGAEVSVSLLAESLASMGHHVATVCLNKEPHLSVDEVNGVRVYRVPLDNIYWPFGQPEKPALLDRLKWHLGDTWNRKAARRFGRILDIEKPDVVHTNNLTGFSVSLWSEANRRDIRIVHTLRDYSLTCKRSTLFKNGAACERRCPACATMTAPYLYASRLVDVVASNSRFVLDTHHRLGYFSRTPDKVIFNIADIRDSVPIARPSGDDLVFGFIGRIEAEKGIDIVLKAVDLLPDAGWRLKIAGAGADPYVNNLKARHRTDRIEWVGFANAREFYASIDVCLISSVWPEPLPRTLIESISNGCATICSTAGGIPEISGMSALIGSYEARDHRRLAELMAKSISEAPRWKERQPIQSGFKEQFSPEAISRQYLAIYTAENESSF